MNTTPSLPSLPPPPPPPGFAPSAPAPAPAGPSKAGLVVTCVSFAAILVIGATVAIVLLLASDGPEDIARDWLAAFNDRDCERIVELAHADYELDLARCHRVLDSRDLRDEDVDLNMEILSLDERRPSGDDLVYRAEVRTGVWRGGVADECGEYIFDVVLRDDDGVWRVVEERFVSSELLEPDDC